MGIEGDISSLTSLNLLFRTSVNANKHINIPKHGRLVEKAIITPSGADSGMTKLITPKGISSKIATGRRRRAFFQFVDWM
jgi:hypothetical protein